MALETHVDEGVDRLGGVGRGLEHQLVGVAPAPVLSLLKAADNGVMRTIEVLGGVLIRRRVTAADVAAGEAQSQVDPPSIGLEALFAAIRSAGSDRMDLVEMGAAHGSDLFPALE